MKKKLNLKHLKVSSFIIELDPDSQFTAKGGSMFLCPTPKPKPVEPPNSGTPACTAPKSWWQNCLQG